MEIWNSRSLDNNQRFAAAIIAGLLAALVFGLAYGVVYRYLRVVMSVLYILIGYGIGTVIRKVGRGVHTRFAVVGAVMTLLAIFIGDVSAGTGIGGFFTCLTHPALLASVFRSWLAGLLSTNINSLLGLLMRAAGIYFGWQQSVIF